MIGTLNGQTGRFTVWADGKQKSWTGKFLPGMAFIICTNQFHFPKTDRASLKLVSKMALKKWNTNSCLKHPDLEKRNKYLFRRRFPFYTFQSDFPETFCTW